MPSGISRDGEEAVMDNSTGLFQARTRQYGRDDLVAIPLSDLRRIMEGRALTEHTTRFVSVPTFPTAVNSESSQDTSLSSSMASSHSREARIRSRRTTGRRTRWLSRFTSCFPRTRSRSTSPGRSGADVVPVPVTDSRVEDMGMTDMRSLRRQLAFSERAAFVLENGRSMVRSRARNTNGSPNRTVNGSEAEGFMGEDSRSVWSNEGDNRSVRSNETETVSNGSLSSLRVNVPWPDVPAHPPPETDEASRNPRMWMRQLDFERATSEIESAMHSLILDELNGALLGRGMPLPRQHRPHWLMGEEDSWTYEELLELDKYNVQIGLRPKEFNQLDRKQQLAKDPKIECRICIQDTAENEVITTLPCQHTYHDDCIKPWLASHRTCPICRFEFPRCSSSQLK